MEIQGAILICPHCGTKKLIEHKKSSRSFMIAYNRFKRYHDWQCETKSKVEAAVNHRKKVAQDTVEDAINKMINHGK